MTKTAGTKQPLGKVWKVVLLLSPSGKRSIVDDVYGANDRAVGR